MMDGKVPVCTVADSVRCPRCGREWLFIGAYGRYRPYCWYCGKWLGKGPVPFAIPPGRGLKL